MNPGFRQGIPQVSIPRQHSSTDPLGAHTDRPVDSAGATIHPDGATLPFPAIPASKYTAASPADHHQTEIAISPVPQLISSRPSDRRAWLFAGTGAALVVVVAIAVTLAVTIGHGKSSTQAGAPGMVSALTSTDAVAPAPGVAASTSTPAPGTAAIDPLIPGFQVVQIPARGAAYDAPRNWQVDPLGTTTWGSGAATVDIAGLAQEGKSYCPNSVRTNAFLTTSAQADPAAAATEVGQRITKIGWPGATGITASTAVQLTSLDGALQGTFEETTGSLSTAAPSCATTFSIYTFAFPGENGHFVMTIAADTGIAKAIDRDTAKKILTSIRPLPGH